MLTAPAIAGQAASSDNILDGSAYTAGDYTAARDAWMRLAERGDADAQAALASLFHGGLGGPRDIEQTLNWYKRAAEQGHQIAQMNLAEMHIAGRDVARDLAEAWLWCNLAAEQGNPWAIRQREELAKMLSADERSRGKTLLASWQNAH